MACRFFIHNSLAVFATARIKLSTCRELLKAAGEKRTVPCSSVPSVRCASGAQCSPPLSAKPFSESAADTRCEFFSPMLN